MSNRGAVKKRYNEGVSTPGLLRLTDRGLYCPEGDFYIDPWQPVDRAVITHAHADHARRGSAHYLTSRAGEGVLRQRLGEPASVRAAEYGEPLTLNGVRVSLHPAGHILGSAQVRVESRGEVWVVSGDYKVGPDPTCAPFEPVRCHTFVTESTFGLPVYRWPAQAAVLADVHAWWRANQEAGRASLLFAYALGKAQRLLAGLDPAAGPVYTHGAVEKVNAAYRASGVRLPETLHAAAAPRKGPWDRALVVAPPSAHGSPWARKFGAASTGFLSGWMQIRGTRRRRAVDRGFVLSDHADWPGLLGAIGATGAQRVWVTHGYGEALARWLRGQGLEARAVPTRFEGERDDPADEPPGEGE
jgi:putative mRNA 3-end processing factor